MNFRSVYRASFYAMLVLATLVLSIDSTDQNRLAMFYPVAVAAAGFGAFFAVDRNPRLGLSKGTANALGLCSLALTYFEWSYDENLLLLALGHWLVYLQVIKMFRPKTSRDDWSLFLMGLVQVLVGSVISQSDTVGYTLFAWGLCSLWVLALFSLARESERGRPAEGTRVLPSDDPDAPYPGLIDMPFALATLRVAAMTLALGGIIFLVMPRRNSMGASAKGDAMGKHLTGFDDEVQLGQLGEILENDSVVMTIELSDSDGNRIAPDSPELLWRGVSMAKYERGRWRRLGVRPSPAFPNDLPGRPTAARTVRQLIKIEPTDNPVLFGLRPVLDAKSSNRRSMPEFNEADGSIHRQESRPVAMEYTVLSSRDPGGLQPRERFPGPNVLRDLLSLSDGLGLSDELRDRLRPIALKVVEGIDPADREARARKLEAYLLRDGGFRYTLRMDVVDAKIDPVVDFLVNRKEGHCEYFASALTLLLRSIDIPARLVNGFKGGDWNDLGKVLSVRQKHAHSWTEALLADAPARQEEPPRWLSLDPTPADERDRSVAQVGGVSTSFRQFSDFVRYVWVFYVVGFNFDRQQRLLYEPFRALVAEARNGFQMMGQALRVAFDWLFHFPDLSSFISARGFVVTFVVLILLALSARLALFVARRVRRVWGGARVDGSTMAVGVSFYRRLVALLEGCGLERPPSETPREFARRASGFLAGHGTGNESVADVPPLVVDAYYRIRFGRAELEPGSLAQVEGRLDALEARLKPATS